MYAIIMAGGVGKRFWPRSRRETPKQMLDIVSNQSMLQLTYNRVRQITDHNKIFIATGQALYAPILRHISDIPEDRVIIEPSGKNTAPCIGLAATIIGNSDPEAVIGVFPADHLITDYENFATTIRTGVEIARSYNSLVTFGINPTHPATGYGYIQIDKKRTIVEDSVYKVKTFAEKPNLNTANRFLKSGEFLWNSGMFIWKTATIINAIKTYLPELYSSLQVIKKSLNTDNYNSVLRSEWATIRSVSIDYGIMEKAKNVYVVKGNFDWSDVGSWDAVYDLQQKDEDDNVIIGNSITMNTNGCLIYSPKHLVSTIGVKDLVIIETKDATLIVKRGETEKVKELVDLLESKKRVDYL